MGRLLQESEHLQLVAGYDPYPPAVEEARALAKSLTVHEHWRGVVDDPSVQWVMVGSPNRFHAEQTIAALDAGKNVFCEKPLALTFEDCLAVREAVQRNPGRFVFGLVMRYSPYYRKLRELIEQGRIGELISF